LLRNRFADSVYTANLRDALGQIRQLTIEIVKRAPPTRPSFMLPRRVSSNRTFAWLNRTAPGAGFLG